MCRATQILNLFLSPGLNGGIINTACQMSPPASLYNIASLQEAKSVLINCKAVETGTPVKGLDRSGRAIERTAGVGAAAETQGTQPPRLVVDLGEKQESINNLSRKHNQKQKSKHREKPITDRPMSSLPVRLGPIGGEASEIDNMSAHSHLTTPDPQTRHSTTYNDGLTQVSKSADSSPKHPRYTAAAADVTLTQYGFIDDGRSISDALEADFKVVGLNDEQLLTIAAKKPERLNATVRHQNRMKRVGDNHRHSAPPDSGMSGGGDPSISH